MDQEVKPQVSSEISLAAVVDSIYNIAQVNVIKKEFSPLEPNSYGGLLNHAVGNIYTGRNIKLEMEEEVKPEVTSEISLVATVDFTSDVHRRSKNKRQFLLSNPQSYGGFVEGAVVKYEDTSSQSLDLQVKSEIPDLKCGIINGNDDIYIKVEPLVSEELHIKDEVEGTVVDQTAKTSTQVIYLYCSLCNSKFKLKGNLQRHQKVHTGAKPFQCNVCDYRSIRKRDLQRHMKTHTGEKPFKCNVCDFKSIQKSNLQLHIKTHTGEKPFKCNVCDYKCIRNFTLQHHMKTHTGEKPFKCDVCDFKCIQKSDLQFHMKTHTGEKPFKCSVCDYKCIRNFTLQRHMETHTEENLLN